MPIIKSARKRVRVTRKATIRNSKTKRTLKAALKTFAKTPSAKSHSEAQSNLDKAVKKGLIHKNKAARLKSKAAARAKAAGIKSGTPKKATAKTPSAKNVAAKKPVAKKTSAKK